MEKQRKSGKYKISYFLEADKIFNVEDRSIDETEFIDRCLLQMSIDLESKENEDFILSKRQIIYLLTGIIREWDNFKESSYLLLSSEKQKSMKKTEYDDFKYLKLSEIMATDEILTSLVIDEPKKIQFIGDYLKERFNVDINKDDLIVFEPIETSHLIVLIYDIVKTFGNKTQKLP
jgi:hypothetical protein